MNPSVDPAAPSAPPAPAPSPAPAPAADPPTAAVFDQAAVDRIVADRLARERAKYADYEAVKAKAEKFDELEAAQLSAVEKATKAAEAAEQRAAVAEQRARETLIRSAIVATAQRAGAVDPDAVVALIDPKSVTFGDDGQVTGAEEAVKALLEAKTYLVGKPAAPAPGAADGGVRPGATPADVDSMPMEAYIAARKSGQIV